MKSSVEFTMSMIRSRANLWDLVDAVGFSVKSTNNKLSGDDYSRATRFSYNAESRVHHRRRQASILSVKSFDDRGESPLGPITLPCLARSRVLRRYGRHDEGQSAARLTFR